MHCGSCAVSLRLFYRTPHSDECQRDRIPRLSTPGRAQVLITSTPAWQAVPRIHVWSGQACSCNCIRELLQKYLYITLRPSWRQEKMETWMMTRALLRYPMSTSMQLATNLCSFPLTNADGYLEALLGWRDSVTIDTIVCNNAVQIHQCCLYESCRMRVAQHNHRRQQKFLWEGYVVSVQLNCRHCVYCATKILAIKACRTPPAFP